MSTNYQDLIEQCNIYLEEYPHYTLAEKIHAAYDIYTLLNNVSKSPQFNYANIEDFMFLREYSLKLDCTLMLIFLDVELDYYHPYHTSEIRTLLQEDSEKNLEELIRKSLKPYVTSALEYQLAQNKGIFQQASDFGNQDLTDLQHYTFTDIIQSIIWLEYNLAKKNLSTKILKEAVKDFSSEEIAFIYAQLSEYNRYESTSDDDAKEELYLAMKEKTKSEKRDFIRTICRLRYCNPAEGIIAMLMDLFDTCTGEDVCFTMYELLLGENREKYGLTEDFIGIAIDQAREAYNLRRKDIAEHKDLRPVKTYIKDSVNNRQKRM